MERDAMDGALSRVRDLSGSVQTRLAQASIPPATPHQPARLDPDLRAGSD